ncbi:M23 family metallopeptidase [Qipengyuania sp. DSG2-2]|uniref:M23 family metallopeptidase n=1 Tax=Qipengyuania sp. DGS2-2 TaxID=3349631 RepID=UPI0036D4315F
MIDRKIAFAVISAFAAMGMSAPANATSASAAAAVEITEAVDEASSPLGAGDDQFSRLFADWKSLDSGSPTAPAPTTTVSVPSRMPLDDARLTSGYGMRTHPVTGGRRAHKGIDLAAPTGTPVYATADGTVERANWFSSYGKFIKIDHGASMETRFAHLSKIFVSAGDRVKKGQLIGHVGSTGRSTGPHLHYEVRIDGKAVNPMPYMVESQAQQAFQLATGQGGRGGD